MAAPRAVLSNVSCSRNFDVSHSHPRSPPSFFTIFTIGPSQTFCQIAAICSTALANPQFSPSRQAVRTRGGWGNPLGTHFSSVCTNIGTNIPSSLGDVQKVGPGAGERHRLLGVKAMGREANCLLNMENGVCFLFWAFGICGWIGTGRQGANTHPP